MHKGERNTRAPKKRNFLEVTCDRGDETLEQAKTAIV